MSALGHKRTFAVQKRMSALPPNVLQNSLPHCDSAIIESDWTVRRINVAHFRLILNQYCARYPLKIVLQHIPPESGHVQCNWGCPLSANTGHQARPKLFKEKPRAAEQS